MKQFPKISTTVNRADDVIIYRLIKTNRRLTFDIIYMHDDLIYKGEDDGDYYKFVASNGYEIISRSRMDIQTERLWLIGAKPNERSGTMVFSTNEHRNAALFAFHDALNEWIDFVTQSNKDDGDPCPGCRKGGVCRTPACGRLKLSENHPYRIGN